MAEGTQKRTIFVYLDEGGNLDFSPSGTPYFTLTQITKVDEPIHDRGTTKIKQKFQAQGINLKKLHASENSNAIREEVFGLISSNISRISIDCVIVEKRKTGPSLQEPVQFYSRMVGYLFNHSFKTFFPKTIGKIKICCDRPPNSGGKLGKALEKAIKLEIAKVQASNSNLRQIVVEHEFLNSEGSAGLEIADYCNWAIYRKWTKQDIKWYQIIQPRLMSEFDIFQKGSTYHY